MELQLLELFLVAKKAGEAVNSLEVSSYHPEVSRCIESLKQLKSFPVTYDLLFATQVGKNIRCFKKHSNKNIRTIAADVLDAWKKLIMENSRKAEISNKSSNETPKKEVEKILGVHASTITRFVTNATTKVDTESIVNLKTYDANRDKIRQLLLEALSRVADEAHEKIKDQVKACDPSKVAALLESILFEKMGSPIGANKFKYRSIMFNLRDKKNPDFRRKVLLGEVKLDTINTMTPEDMASNEMQDEYHTIKMRLSCSHDEVTPKATTDQFKCGKCGERKTTYYQLQTRSADEPMTTYVTCVNCNNRWKFC